MADTQKVDTFTSSGNWTCPAGVTSAVVECWGAGGGGTEDVGGGGGGAYSKKTVSVTPTNVYAVAVGTSAVDTNGGDSTFATTTVVAKGGLSGTNGGTGGTAAASTGDTKYDGGDGYQGGEGYECAGGGGAGDWEDGEDADADADVGGGRYNGGDGFGTDYGGYGITVGHLYGGGGFGGYDGGDNTTIAGGRGEVRITYNMAATSGYPNIISRSYGYSNGNPQTISMPTGISVGNLLICIVALHSTATVSDASGLWTKLGQDTGTSIGQAIFYKVATGTDSLSLTGTSQPMANWVVYNIANAGTPEHAFAHYSGAGVKADPPSLTPSGGDAKYLWLASAGLYAEYNSLSAITAPTNYGDMFACTGSGGYSGQLFQVSTTRYLQAASDNPSEFTTVDVDYWLASTIAVPYGGTTVSTPTLTLLGAG